MANYISGAQLWAIVLFIPLFLYSIFFITGPVQQAALKAGLTSGRARNIRLGIISFYIIYLAYASVLALKGLLDVNSLPPRVMVWAGIPLIVILFGLAGNTRLFKRILQAITLESLIRIHIFRLLGVFFIILYGYRLLPARFAFFAGLGDIITAIFALPVAWMVAARKPGWKTALYAWNIFGIMDVIDLLIVAVITGANGNLREIAIFPFVWFPAFAPATILFLHVAVFRKLRMHSPVPEPAGKQYQRFNTAYGPLLNKPKIFLTLLFVAHFATSCFETKTTNAKDTFKYWAGTNVPDDIEVMNGEYWQSSHWTKEYIMYLKFKPTKRWWDQFAKQNNLTPESTDWVKPADAPDWFKPADNSQQLRQGEFSQGSRYFCDTTTGICYIYEIQL